MDSSTITVFEGFLCVLGFCLPSFVVAPFFEVLAARVLPFPLKMSFKEKRPPFPEAEREDFDFEFPALDFPAFRPPRLLSAPFFPPLLPAELLSPLLPLAPFPPPFPLSPPFPFPPPLPLPPPFPLPSLAKATSGAAMVATMAADPSNAITTVDAFSRLKLVVFMSTSSVEFSGHQFFEPTRCVQSFQFARIS
ncbi:hypothetical protein [Ruegeria halocynthiae]|uniref:hypothetical protein n=1 Tax=Ruegeria halocynthiae TaxID=985054 RepID=UPI00115FD39A|nr:hypothetical protein [Ruegeria halocynthiae]